MNDLSHMPLSRFDARSTELRFDAIASRLAPRGATPTESRAGRGRSPSTTLAAPRYLDDPVGNYETTAGGW
jgi:hypothetical protein